MIIHIKSITRHITVGEAGKFFKHLLLIVPLELYSAISIKVTLDFICDLADDLLIFFLPPRSCWYIYSLNKEVVTHINNCSTSVKQAFSFREHLLSIFSVLSWPQHLWYVVSDVSWSRQNRGCFGLQQALQSYGADTLFFHRWFFNPGCMPLMFRRKVAVRLLCVFLFVWTPGAMGFCTVSVGTSFSADFAGMVLVDSLCWYFSLERRQAWFESFQAQH